MTQMPTQQQQQRHPRFSNDCCHGFNDHPLSTRYAVAKLLQRAHITAMSPQQRAPCYDTHPSSPCVQ